MIKKYREKLFQWFFQLENEIMVPFLLVGIFVIGGFFGISFYSGYTMQRDSQELLANTLFEAVNQDVAYLSEYLPEAVLREKYRDFGQGMVKITDESGQILNPDFSWENQTVFWSSEEENVLGWKLEFMAEKHAFQETVLEKQNYVVVGAIAALLIMAQVSIFISHSITKPIRQMSRTCRQIDENKGNYRSYKFPAMGRRDEMGQLAVTFDGLLKSMDNYTKMEYTSRMSATLAHEIKNPIAGIRSGIQLLKGRTEKENDKKLCDSMIHEIDRVTGLIMNLFTLSVKRESPKTEVPLDRVLNEIAMIYAKGPDGSKASLEADIEKGLTGWLNENEFRQLIHNLVSNSLKAMVPGREGQIRIEGISEGNRAKILFMDNGKGMTGEELTKAMEPFYTKSINGIGLGLSIVRKLVEQNDGTMRMDSIPGEGTWIVMEFNRKEPQNGTDFNCR